MAVPPHLRKERSQTCGRYNLLWGIHYSSPRPPSISVSPPIEPQDRQRTTHLLHWCAVVSTLVTRFCTCHVYRCDGFLPTIGSRVIGAEMSIDLQLSLYHTTTLHDPTNNTSLPIPNLSGPRASSPPPWAAHPSHRHAPHWRWQRPPPDALMGCYPARGGDYNVNISISLVLVSLSTDLLPWKGLKRFIIRVCLFVFQMKDKWILPECIKVSKQFPLHESPFIINTMISYSILQKKVYVNIFTFDQMMFYISVIKPTCIPYYTSVSHLPRMASLPSHRSPAGCWGRVGTVSPWSFVTPPGSTGWSYHMPHRPLREETKYTSLFLVVKEFDSLLTCRD